MAHANRAALFEEDFGKVAESGSWPVVVTFAFLFVFDTIFLTEIHNLERSFEALTDSAENR